jgi:hypothetical protein
MFARLVCDLCFTEIDTKNTIAHPFTYFVHLPNDDQEVMTSTGTIVQLNTFHGQDDWATGIVDQVTIDTILKNDQAFGSPFTLLPSSIINPLPSAVIDSTEFGPSQNRFVGHLAFNLQTCIQIVIPQS